MHNLRYISIHGLFWVPASLVSWARKQMWLFPQSEGPSASHQGGVEKCQGSTRSHLRGTRSSLITISHQCLNTFQVVWLSSQNFLLQVDSRKLSSLFIGPFPIVKVINPLEAKVMLPAYLNIHPFFHVSLIKSVASYYTIVNWFVPIFNLDFWTFSFK